MHDPEPSLLQIIKMAQEIIFEPKDRKLITTKNHVEEIIEAVKERFGKPAEKIVKYVDKYAELEKRIVAIESFLKLKPKIKIALAGFKNNQYHEVRKAVEDHVELLLIDREQSQPPIPSSANYVIVSKDFTSHGFINYLYSLYPRDQVKLIDGAANSAIKAIETLL